MQKIEGMLPILAEICISRTKLLWWTELERDKKNLAGPAAKMEKRIVFPVLLDCVMQGDQNAR